MIYPFIRCLGCAESVVGVVPPLAIATVRPGPLPGAQDAPAAPRGGRQPGTCGPTPLNPPNGCTCPKAALVAPTTLLYRGTFALLVHPLNPVGFSPIGHGLEIEACLSATASPSTCGASWSPRPRTPRGCDRGGFLMNITENNENL